MAVWSVTGTRRTRLLNYELRWSQVTQIHVTLTHAQKQLAATSEVYLGGGGGDGTNPLKPLVPTHPEAAPLPPLRFIF